MASTTSGVNTQAPKTTRPPTPKPGTTQPPTVLRTGKATSEGGIVVNDHPVWRNLLRWGGAAVALGGVAALGLGMQGGAGIATARSGGALALGLVGGGAMFGSSFLVKPTVVPFIKGHLPSQDAAVQYWNDHVRDDVAIYKVRTGDYGIVDFRTRDFDNTDLDHLSTGNRHVQWQGLLTRDGDFLRQVGPTQFQNIGRATPRPLDLTRLDATSSADLAKVQDQQIGTTDDHQRGRLGARIGSPEGYATYQDATIAAYGLGTKADHAVVHVGNRYFLYDVKLPPGDSVTSLQARGAGIAPVSNVAVQEENKVYRARTFGKDIEFATRATMFSTAEPLGKGVGGHTITKLVRSFPDRTSAVNFIRRTYTDDIWTGRNVGVSLVWGKNPDGSGGWHVYQLEDVRNRGTLDTQLAPAAFADMQYRTWTDREYENWDSETSATVYSRSWDRRSVTLEDIGGGVGSTSLRDTGDHLLTREVDYFGSQQRRDELRAARLAAEEAARQEAARQAAEAARRAQEEADRQRQSQYPSSGSGGTSPSDSGSNNSGPGNPSSPSSSNNSGPGNPGFG